MSEAKNEIVQEVFPKTELTRWVHFASTTLCPAIAVLTTKNQKLNARQWFSE